VKHLHILYKYSRRFGLRAGYRFWYQFKDAMAQPAHRRYALIPKLYESLDALRPGCAEWQVMGEWLTDLIVANDAERKKLLKSCVQK
jgi:hypothetical protein